MKKLVFILACLSAIILSSCERKSESVSTKMSLATCSFKGQADFTSCLYSFKGQADFTSCLYWCYGLGCRPADSLELVTWAKGRDNLPDRIYLIKNQREPLMFLDKTDAIQIYLIKNQREPLMFLDKTGVIRTESIQESNRWLANSKNLLILIVKDQAIIDEFYAGKDPAPNFLTK